MEFLNEDRLWMPLFYERSDTSPAQELARVTEWARCLLEGDRCNEDLDLATGSSTFGHYQLSDAIRDEELPAEGIEALAGMTALAAPRGDDAMEYAGGAVWSLTDPTLQPTSVASALLKSTHATYPPLTDEEGEYVFRPTDTEGERGPSTDEWRELVDRTAPLSAGGVSLANIQRDRPVAWHNRHIAPIWEALCALFDVFVGSRLAVEQLVGIAERAGDAPALLWLAEAGLRLAGEPERAARCGERVDALIASGIYGKNAQKLTALRDRRAELASYGHGPSDAILRIGAIEREDRIPAQEQLEQDAANGDELATARISLQDYMEDDTAEVEWSRVAEGPFHGLEVPEDLREEVDWAIEEIMVGFRCVYGLERLSAAMPGLAAWRAQMAC